MSDLLERLEMWDVNKRDVQSFIILMIGVVCGFYNPWMLGILASLSALIIIYGSGELTRRNKREVFQRMDDYASEFDALKKDLADDGGRIAKEVIEMKDQINDIKISWNLNNE